jgi:hypothetical protein
MQEAMILAISGSHIAAIDIPSIAAALHVMRAEILNAKQPLRRIQEAAISLKVIIQNWHFVEEIAHHEVSALRQSAHNFELAGSEMQQRNGITRRNTK